MVTPVAIETIGWQYYLVFLVISAIIVPVVYFFYPETMGRSLEELEMMFSEGNSITSIVKESRKPLNRPLYQEDVTEKASHIDKDEYVH
jgi:hypothetical protein